MSSKEKIAECMANMSEDKKKMRREADKVRKAMKRASMTEEEKEAVKEKDKLKSSQEEL